MGRLLLLLSLAPRTVGGFQPMHVREAPRAAVVARGIPKMFRWLTDQYPAIMERMADGLPAQQKKSDVDDLYLDMNGIIHMCTHGNDPEIAETSARDQLVRIFAFTDKVCKIVAPKRTIVLAVDGVAPVVLGGRDPVEPEPVVVRHRRSAYADDVLVPKSTIRLRSPPWLHHPESA